MLRFHTFIRWAPIEIACEHNDRLFSHVYQVCTTLRVSINWKCGLSPIVIMAPLFCFHLHTFTFIFVTFARSSPFSNSPSVYLLCSTQFQSISLLGFHVSFLWIQQLPPFGIELILNVEGRQLELNSTQHQHVLSYIYVLIGFCTHCTYIHVTPRSCSILTDIFARLLGVYQLELWVEMLVVANWYSISIGTIFWVYPLCSTDLHVFTNVHWLLLTVVRSSNSCIYTATFTFHIHTFCVFTLHYFAFICSVPLSFSTHFHSFAHSNLEWQVYTNGFALIGNVGGRNLEIIPRISGIKHVF